MADISNPKQDSVSIDESIKFVSLIANRLSQISKDENHGDGILNAERIHHGFEVLHLPSEIVKDVERMLKSILAQFPDKQAASGHIAAAYELTLRACDTNSNGVLEGDELRALDAKLNAMAAGEIPEQKTRKGISR